MGQAGFFTPFTSTSMFCAYGHVRLALAGPSRHVCRASRPSSSARFATSSTQGQLAVASTQANSEAAVPVLSTTQQLLDASAGLFLSLPSSLGGLSHAATIVLMTLCLRTSITLPMTVWQRRRIRRVQELVVPAAKRWMQTAKLSLRADFRKAGKEYEEYVAALNKQAKQQFKKLAAVYKCRPLPTMIIPPLVHLPVFISTTLAIRQACNVSATALTTEISSGMHDDTALAAIQHQASLALEPFMWCPSLAEVDPYIALPLAVSLTAFANVELQARIRERLAAAQVNLAESSNRSERPATSSEHHTPPSETIGGLARPRPGRPVAAIPRILQKRGASSSSTTSFSAPSRETTPKASSTDISRARSQGITNVLRFASILFIPIAASAPVAVNLYWLTSNLFSLAQSIVLARLDQK